MICCYCESSYKEESLINHDGSWWHQHCLESRNRYLAYLRGDLPLESLPKMLKPAERHQQIYEHIKKYHKKTGQTPTINNLIVYLKYDRSVIHASIKALVKKGLLKKQDKLILLP